jgi:hypothetical protein
MMITLLRRLRKEDEGYALVIAVLLLSVMMVLLVVALDAGNSALRQTTQGMEWSRTLTIAEAGANDMVARLGQSRTATSPCAMGTSDVCTGAGGDYQVSWVKNAGNVVVTSIGYYPSRASAQFTREVQVTYEPVPSFQYAIFSDAAISIMNGMHIAGDVYSNGDITVGTNAVVCGSVLSGGGGVTLQNGSQVVKSYADLSCTGKSGKVWSGGSGGIIGALGVTIAGDAWAGAPGSIDCSSTSSYRITSSGGSTHTVQGAAQACGTIDSISGPTSSTQRTATSQPAPLSMPTFVFDPDNYTDLTCYPSGGTCGSNQSLTAVSDFNTWVQNAANKTTLSGTYAVWQSAPNQSTRINLEEIGLAGDFTIITNAPIDFGNTSTIATTDPTGSELTAVSTYTGNVSTACDPTNIYTTGDCSIMGKNSIEFDAGLLSDPDDGVVGLLYTPGKMAFQNQCVTCGPGEGALYASSISMQNNYDIIYNSRVERTLGFGQNLQQTLWQEINV